MAPKSSAAIAPSTEKLITQYGELTVLDDLIQLRATDEIQCPILAYPSSNTDGGSYDYYTGKDLNGIIIQAVNSLVEYGFKPQMKYSYVERPGPPIVALLTLSDLNMVVTFFALSRLGYTVMMLSPRLSASACVSLLDSVQCDTILYGQTASIRRTMGEILQLKGVACRPIHFQSTPSDLHELTTAILNWIEDIGNDSVPDDVAVILHSSGSTGTPKPLFLTHKALMTHPLRGPGLTSFNSLPWYHLHGLSTAFQAMWMRKTAFMWDASLPVTGERLAKALDGTRPESVHAVPYVLQLLVDTECGIEALKKCKLVTYGGAPCPDELGDRLVRAGVSFGGSFGLTEAGLVAESISRPLGDPFWNYMRFFENIRPYIWMKPLSQHNTDTVAENDSDPLYECVYLSGHPALTASNSDDPPGSFHSKDVFKPHPSLPERWKYITRLDDRITLVNGEKVLPLPIEGLVKQHPLIQDAVVVGINRTAPGLLVFRSERATDENLSDREYLEAIWPVIQEANSRSEKFSQISKSTVAVLSSEVSLTCPRTDKGSMIRAQAYRQFSDVIDKIYMKFDQPGDGTLRLDLEKTKEQLMRSCNEELGLSIQNVDADLFSAGVDSLKAIHLRRLVLRDFHISDSSRLGQNVVFETQTVSRLAEKIVALQNGNVGNCVNEKSEDDVEDELSLMSKFIAKYSSFRGHVPCQKQNGDKRSVILTGPTGSIGVHTLVELLKDISVDKIYCLSRRENPLSPILKAMENKNLASPDFLQHATQKIVAVKSNLDSPDLGLDLVDSSKQLLHEMRQNVSVIIHTAWPVNFQFPLRSFEEHIRGLHNLIQFSLDVKMPDPAVVMFCSSISTAMGKTDDETEIPDGPMEDLTSALEMGYARSKLVGEKIVSLSQSSVGARAYSLRIGQVSGHSELGLWNDSEAIPLMIRSALTVKALPEIDEICSWLPADKLAKTILDIAASNLESTPGNREKEGGHEEEEGGGGGGKKAETNLTAKYNGVIDDTVYNICNPNTFTWSQLLTALNQQGFAFSKVPFETWLRLLRESEEKGEEHANPAVKLITHYDAMYSDRDSRTHFKKFRTDRAERDSETLRSGNLGIIQQGILQRYVKDWLERWT